MYRTSFLINGINFISRILLRLFSAGKSCYAQCCRIAVINCIDRSQRRPYTQILKGAIFSVLLSTLFHLPPLRYHCVGGCWDLGQMLNLIHTQLDLIHIRLYSVRSACKLRARRTEYKSVFFSYDINC